MTESESKRLFDKFNPVSDIVRCPNGRAIVRKALDIYAQAAVNLYGIIRRDEFVKIFNSQNTDQTTSEEVYILLLPLVLKSGWYGFYKDYIVHYAVLHDFDWVENLEAHQADKPRYIPEREEFLKYADENYEDNDHWWNVHKFLFNAFGYSKNTSDGFEEIKNYLINSSGIHELGSILDKYNLIFNEENQMQEFLQLLMTARNNSRIWENNGYTASEMYEILSERKQKVVKFPIQQRQKVGRNDPCPCGSGKKYKKCCGLIAESGLAQLSPEDLKLFYETWYKLLDFVNQKLGVVSIRTKPVYPQDTDESKLHKIREKLWENPELIDEFIEGTDDLSETEINLLKSWREKHIKDSFILMSHTAEYSIFMGGGPTKLYAVKGMTSSIADAVHRPLPIMLETVLLPFKDVIIYDSFIAAMSIGFGSGAMEMFEADYNKSLENFGIITKL